ncbi:hypothetical protein CKAH01_02392 [Colletotrichum kahawae]|uniref:Uncharacterized protein n=1 Tax=Colletotrichum kahawae TaxID=34407 RepID=A0AAD9XYH1_COLKA|nr:hypothetical protein CKAH01_02392 [Colletotrichum kahawae]
MQGSHLISTSFAVAFTLWIFPKGKIGVALRSVSCPAWVSNSLVLISQVSRHRQLQTGAPARQRGQLPRRLSRHWIFLS